MLAGLASISESGSIGTTVLVGSGIMLLGTSIAIPAMKNKKKAVLKYNALL